MAQTWGHRDLGQSLGQEMPLGPSNGVETTLTPAVAAEAPPHHHHIITANKNTGVIAFAIFVRSQLFAFAWCQPERAYLENIAEVLVKLCQLDLVNYGANLARPLASLHQTRVLRVCTNRMPVERQTSNQQP